MGQLVSVPVNDRNMKHRGSLQFKALHVKKGVGQEGKEGADHPCVHLTNWRV